MTIIERTKIGDEMRGGGHQICVVPCFRSVGEDVNVFQTGANSVASFKSPPIDGPTGNAVAVVYLLQGDSRRKHNVFHGFRVENRCAGVGVERLDQDAATPWRQSGTDEGMRVVNAEESGFDTDASGQEQHA